jgi:hypothetical protein
VGLPPDDVLRFGGIADGTAGQVIYTCDHFELLLINTELLRKPLTTVANGEVVQTAGVFHLDSLDRQTKEISIKPMSTMRSNMAREIAAPTGDSVITLPAVLQPPGSRICGVCACVNQLLLVSCSLEEIMAGELGYKGVKFSFAQSGDLAITPAMVCIKLTTWMSWISARSLKALAIEAALSHRTSRGGIPGIGTGLGSTARRYANKSSCEIASIFAISDDDDVSDCIAPDFNCSDKLFAIFLPSVESSTCPVETRYSYQLI